MLDTQPEPCVSFGRAATDDVRDADRTLHEHLQQSLSLCHAIWIPSHIQLPSALPLTFACPWGGMLLAVPPSDAPPRGPDQTADIAHTLSAILQHPHHAADLAAAWRARVLASRCAGALAAAAGAPASPPSPCHPARPPLGKPPWLPTSTYGGTNSIAASPQAPPMPLPTLSAAATSALSAALAVLLADLVRLLTTQHAGHANLLAQLWNLQARLHALQHGTQVAVCKKRATLNTYR